MQNKSLQPDQDLVNNRQSGIHDLGMDLLSGDMSDDSDDEDMPPVQKSRPISPGANMKQMPIAAPQPGYAAPVSAIKMPQPSLSPQARAVPPPPGLPVPADPRVPYSIAIPTPVPSSPHPLTAPLTPITPAFARPPKSPTRDVKFSEPSILRGNSEETLLPKRGEKGDDFWRRFSMIAKENTPQQSAWLKKNQSSTTRMSRWIWVIGIFLLLIIGGAIGLGVYLAHTSTSHTGPVALGGSADERITTTSSTSLHATLVSTSSPTKVTPTRTINNKRSPTESARATGTPDGGHHVDFSKRSVRNRAI